MLDTITVVDVNCLTWWTQFHRHYSFLYMYINLIFFISRSMIMIIAISTFKMQSSVRFIFLLLIFHLISVNSGNSVSKETNSDIDRFQPWNGDGDAPMWYYKHDPPFAPSGTHNAIFIHALVGIFKKRKGGGTWGHGLDILLELIDLVQSSGLIDQVEGVYIVLLGTTPNRDKARSTLEEKYGNHERTKKVRVILESSSAELAEFPALHAMQLYANSTSPGTRLLYMHTKGVRRNGWHADYPIQWRRYMSFFLVEKAHVCLAALTLRGYRTCGVLKNRNIYEGNFWWSTAGWLKDRHPVVNDLEWSTKNRYAAEEYIMKNVKGMETNSHYCVHHTHHNMQVCATPRYMYENVSLAFRVNPQCYNSRLERKNKTKVPSSWCHHHELPVIN